MMHDMFDWSLRLQPEGLEHSFRRSRCHRILMCDTLFVALTAVGLLSTSVGRTPFLDVRLMVAMLVAMNLLEVWWIIHHDQSYWTHRPIVQAISRLLHEST
jgi:hypothetical protein